MKKNLLLLALTLLLTILPVSTLADETTDKNLPSGDYDITISFKMGEGTININGVDVEVEKPFNANGTMLVPLRVITESFGANVAWNAESQTIDLGYSGVKILLTVNQKDAIVDGHNTTLLEAPVIVNGKTMVPLRFITENFGADVSFDEETGKITVMKHISSENSIKDFSLILKKTQKERVGDSYYGWSMNIPKKFKLEFRNFNGILNLFQTDDEDYYLLLSIRNVKSDTLDSISQEALKNAKDYTIVDQGRKSAAGEPYYHIVTKTKDVTYNDRYFIKNGKVYYVSLKATDNEKYKNDKEIPAILDSFNLTFKSDGSTEDLSDVVDGCRTFENRKLKFSVKIPAEWIRIEDDDKPHDVRFVLPSKTDSTKTQLFQINMYSKEKGLTTTGWINHNNTLAGERFNPKRIQINSPIDATLDGKPAKRQSTIIQYDNGKVYDETIFHVGTKYKYCVFYAVYEEMFNNRAERATLDAALNSFTFTEPDPDDVGMLIDHLMIPETKTYRKIENAQYKFSMELPTSWTATTNNDDTKNIKYYDNDRGVGISLNVSAINTSISDFVSYFDSEVVEKGKNNGTLVKESEITLFKDGLMAYKYILNFKDGKTSYKQHQYFFIRDGSLYSVTMLCDDLNYTTSNVEILDRVWESIALK